MITKYKAPEEFHLWLWPLTIKTPNWKIPPRVREKGGSVQKITKISRNSSHSLSALRVVYFILLWWGVLSVSLISLRARNSNLANLPSLRCIEWTWERASSVCLYVAGSYDGTYVDRWWLWEVWSTLLLHFLCLSPSTRWWSAMVIGSWGHNFE